MTSITCRTHYFCENTVSYMDLIESLSNPYEVSLCQETHDPWERICSIFSAFGPSVVSNGPRVLT
jgi:hypothetical protein